MFYAKYLSRKKMYEKVYFWAVPKVRPSLLKIKLITLNYNKYWFLGDRSLIVSVIKNWDPKNFNDKKSLSELFSEFQR